MPLATAQDVPNCRFRDAVLCGGILGRHAVHEQVAQNLAVRRRKRLDDVPQLLRDTVGLLGGWGGG
jgi:hypothetical protein